VPRASGNLTKDRARDSPAEPTFDPVERLDDLDLACEHDKERALSAFVDSEFSRTKVEVGGCPGEALQIDRRKSRKQRDRHNVVDRQHSFPPFAFTQAMIGTSERYGSCRAFIITPKDGARTSLDSLKWPKPAAAYLCSKIPGCRLWRLRLLPTKDIERLSQQVRSGSFASF
jgi:hypothetical protein